MTEIKSNTSLNDLYKEALSYKKGNDFETALRVFSVLLKKRPNSPEVHYQVAETFYSGFKSEKAIYHYDIALQLKPKQIEIWIGLIRAIVFSFNDTAAKKYLKILKNSKLASADKLHLQNMLKNRSDGSKVTADIADYGSLESISEDIAKNRKDGLLFKVKTIQAKYPNSASAQEICGEAYASLGMFEDAIAAFKYAIKIDPKYWRAHKYLGDVLAKKNLPYEAICHYRDAHFLVPHSIPTIIALCWQMTVLGRPNDATDFYKNALKRIKSNPELWLFAGNHFVTQGEVKTGQKLLDQAIESETLGQGIYYQIASAYLFREAYDEAKKYSDLAVEKDPDNYRSFSIRADVFSQLGDLEAAEKDRRKALELEPNSSTVLLAYMRSKKGTEEPKMLERMITLFEQTDERSERIELGYAIAKGLEDQGRFGEVFNYLDESNRLMMELNPLSAERLNLQFEEFKAMVQGFDLSHFDKAGFEDAKPIFVTGLPRSGTTLTEQIISAHPKVVGAGEVGQANFEALKRVSVQTQKERFLRKIIGIPREEIHELGKVAWQHLKSLHPNAEYITDKAINSFLYAGILQAAMPNAKIIVVRRDPRDNLLSMYKNRFEDGAHRYSCDLKLAAIQYNGFVECVRQWKILMPDKIYEVQYEDLTKSPEEETRKLIEYCGLPWDDACLSPHKSKRAVKTLSIHQVRQPIYTSSVKSWQRYEKHLQPMFDVLKEAGNYPSDD